MIYLTARNIKYGEQLIKRAIWFAYQYCRISWAYIFYKFWENIAGLEICFREVIYKNFRDSPQVKHVLQLGIQCLREFQLLNAFFLKITFLHYKTHLIFCLSFSLLANIQHHPFINASSPKGLRSQNSDIHWHLVSACFTNLFQSATETADFAQKHFKMFT